MILEGGRLDSFFAPTADAADFINSIGHKRTSIVTLAMSAFGWKADMSAGFENVCL